jgi:hypothetical protein
MHSILILSLLAAFANPQASSREEARLQELKAIGIPWHRVIITEDDMQYRLTRFEVEADGIHYFKQELENPERILHCHRSFQDGALHLTCSGSLCDSTQTPNEYFNELDAAYQAASQNHL